MTSIIQYQSSSRDSGARRKSSAVKKSRPSRRWLWPFDSSSNSDRDGDSTTTHSSSEQVGNNATQLCESNDIDSITLPGFKLPIVMLRVGDDRKFDIWQTFVYSELSTVAQVMESTPQWKGASLLVAKQPGIMILEPQHRMATYCDHNDLLIVVPNKANPYDCLKRAKPILKSQQVSSLLQSSGIDSNAWNMKDERYLHPICPPSRVHQGYRQQRRSTKTVRTREY